MDSGGHLGIDIDYTQGEHEGIAQVFVFAAGFVVIDKATLVPPDKIFSDADTFRGKFTALMPPLFFPAM